MPEGPSLLIISKTLKSVLKGQVITKVSGNGKFEIDTLLNQKIIDVKSWGKHLLIITKRFTIRIHFLLFGSYSIDEHIKADRSIRLKMTCGKKVVYFYTCSIKLLPGNINNHYDWEADVLNKKWNIKKAKAKLKQQPNALVCDAL